MTDPRPIEERITEKTDLAIAGSTSVSSSVGGLSFSDMGQVMEFSKLMSVSRQAVPKHLRGEPGACLAISLQALNWRMDPFAVANKSYMVNDRIAYEAQLIHAVIEQRAPIKGRIKGKVEGEGATRKWRLTATSAEDGDLIEYEGPEIGKITTKNSPLWKADPDQQLWYYSVRAMCRRHFPDVILGVYEKEEIEQAEGMRDVTPKEGGFASLAKSARSASAAAAEATGGRTEPEVAEAEVLTPESEDGAPTEDFSETDTDGAFPGSDEFTKGVTAFQEGKPLSDCPYDMIEAKQEAIDWLGGWKQAKEAAE